MEKEKERKKMKGKNHVAQYCGKHRKTEAILSRSTYRVESR